MMHNAVPLYRLPWKILLQYIFEETNVFPGICESMILFVFNMIQDKQFIIIQASDTD